MGSFDQPWSKWSRITDPDPDHIKRNAPDICLPKLACEYNRISSLSITEEVSLGKRSQGREAMKGSSTPKLSRGSTPTLWPESEFLVVGRLRNYDDDEDNFI